MLQTLDHKGLAQNLFFRFSSKTFNFFKKLFLKVPLFKYFLRLRSRSNFYQRDAQLLKGSKEATSQKTVAQNKIIFGGLTLIVESPGPPSIKRDQWNSNGSSSLSEGHSKGSPGLTIAHWVSKGLTGAHYSVIESIGLNLGLTVVHWGLIGLTVAQQSSHILSRVHLRSAHFFESVRFVSKKTHWGSTGSLFLNDGLILSLEFTDLHRGSLGLEQHTPRFYHYFFQLTKSSATSICKYFLIHRI